MYRLEFENEDGQRIIICKSATEQDARAAMVKELHLRGIKPYYYRSWGDEKEITIDYGSHSCFYHIIRED